MYRCICTCIITTLYSCCVCDGCHDNHLLVKCDTCGDYYHINCLDPPLSKVPKKTAQYGWYVDPIIRFLEFQMIRGPYIIS